MAYTDYDGLEAIKQEEILLQLAGECDPLTINSDWIDRAIADADSIIDMYCKKKYTVPFSPVPHAVKNWSSVLAIGKLYERNNSGMADGSEGWQVQVDFVYEQLKMIMSGEIELDAPTTNTDSVFIQKYETAKFSIGDMDGLL